MAARKLGAIGINGQNLCWTTQLSGPVWAVRYQREISDYGFAWVMSWFQGRFNFASSQNLC